MPTVSGDTDHRCQDCLVDISHKFATAKRCDECRVANNRRRHRERGRLRSSTWKGTIDEPSKRDTKIFTRGLEALEKEPWLTTSQVETKINARQGGWGAACRDAGVTAQQIREEVIGFQRRELTRVRAELERYRKRYGPLDITPDRPEPPASPCSTRRTPST